MADENINISTVTRLSLLERDVTQFSEVTKKLDDTITKLTEISTAVKQILAVHEERFKNIESDYTEARASINGLRDNINSTIKELQERIKELEKWRWYLAGLGVAFGPLLTILLKKIQIGL